MLGRGRQNKDYLQGFLAGWLLLPRNIQQPGVCGRDWEEKKVGGHLKHTGMCSSRLDNPRVYLLKE